MCERDGVGRKVTQHGQMSALHDHRRFHLRQRRLGLREPEGHLHSLIHLDSGRQLGTGLLPLPGGGIQRAEAPVTVRLEWAHAQLLGEGQGLLVVGCSLFDFCGVTMCGNLAEEAQDICLMAAFLVGTGMLAGTDGKGARLLQAAGVQMRLAQGEEQRHLATQSAA